MEKCPKSGKIGGLPSQPYEYLKTSDTRYRYQYNTINNIISLSLSCIFFKRKYSNKNIYLFYLAMYRVSLPVLGVAIRDTHTTTKRNRYVGGFGPPPAKTFKVKTLPI